MPEYTQPHEEVLAEYLQDPRDVAAYLNAALEDSDDFFLEALGDVAATVTTMKEVADRAGVARQAAYRMLSRKGNPTFASLLGILKALGLRLAVEADIINRPRLTEAIAGDEIEDPSRAAEIAGSGSYPLDTMPTDESAGVHLTAHLDAIDFYSALQAARVRPQRARISVWEGWQTTNEGQYQLASSSMGE